MSLKEHLHGLQHIGIPTNNLAQTIAFYESLGFEVAHRNHTPTEPVVFLTLQNLTIEAYENKSAALHPGAVDHFAIDVSHIEAVYQAVKALGYQELEDGIQFLPFWEKGVRYFTILGPNGEKVEFSEKL